MANQEAPFEVWVGNLRAYTEGKVVGKWVSFPQSEEEPKRKSLRFSLLYKE